MKARTRRHTLKGLTVIAGLVAAAALPAACGSSDNKKGNSGNGGGGGAGGDASANSGGSGNNGGFIGSGATGNGGGSNADAADGCGVANVAATTKPVNILLVVDRSASMDSIPAGFGSTTKWSAMKTALDAAVSATQNSVNYGMELFPYPVSDASGECSMPTGAAAIQVPIQSASDGGSAALTQIDTALQIGPGGYTPTATALADAYTYFTSGAGASLQGDKYVLLATDGGPNCTSNLSLTCTSATCTLNMDNACGLDGGVAGGNCCDQTAFTSAVRQFCLDNVDTVTQLTALKTAGIKTIVVGIPGSEAYSTYLDQFALAGGAPANTTTSPMYYKVDSSGGAAALTTVLTDVTKQLVTSCTQTLTNIPQDADLNRIDVLVDFGSGPQEIPKVSLDASASIDGGTAGWTLDTTVIPPVVTLLGSTCAQVQTLGAQSVQVILGCKDIPIR